MSSEQWTKFGLGVLAGAIIGGGIALLYAPKSGRETRGLIRTKSGEFYDVFKRKVVDVRQTVGEKIAGGECFPPGKDVNDVN
jgi:gas vesicle protein